MVMVPPSLLKKTFGWRRIRVYSDNTCLKKHLEIHKTSHNFTKFLTLENKTASSTVRSAKEHTLLMEDPLWKEVCTETVRMMGPLAQHIEQARLGSFSPQDKTIELYCQTDEVAQFIQQYTFIILGSLRRYFPALKELRVSIEGCL